MNLFRSEEHVRNWSLYDLESADGIMPLRHYGTLFGTGLFRQRVEPDYVLRLPQLAVEWMAALAKLGKTGPFWRLGVAKPNRSGVGTLNMHLPRSILVAVAAVCVLALVACGGGSTTTSVGESAVGTRVQVGDGAYFDITPQTLKSWLGAKDFLLVNVFASYMGEIESTDKFIPLNQIEGRLGELPQRDAKIVVYCRSGATSAQAARKLVQLGYTNVWNLAGGMIAWQQAGYPLIQAQHP